MTNPGKTNLKGFAVGDGCMGTEVLCGSGNPDSGPKWHIEFMHGHGAVSERNYAQIMAECPDEVQRTGKGASAACTAAIKQMASDHTHSKRYPGSRLIDVCAGISERQLGRHVRLFVL